MLFRPFVRPFVRFPFDVCTRMRVISGQQTDIQQLGFITIGWLVGCSGQKKIPKIRFVEVRQSAARRFLLIELQTSSVSS